MNTQINFKSLFTLIFLLTIFQLQAQNQRRITPNTKAPTRTIAPQQSPNPEPDDPSIFYQKLPKRILDLPVGEDGDHEHEMEEPGIRTAPTSALRSNVRSPMANTIWNNRAFNSNKDIVTSEAPNTGVALRAGSGYCSAPIIPSGMVSVYAGAKAHMPLYVPYRHRKATVWQGFYYNNGNYHGSIDYGKTGISRGEDPAFGVYSIAAGTVVDVGWTNGGGNFVTIEHTAPNGFKYRS